MYINNPIKTPIIFTVQPFIEEEQDPIIPQPNPLTLDNELDLITQPILLAKRYYLKIKAPYIITNDAGIAQNEFKYYIPWQGIYKDQVRLALTPTVGWGEGSCYTVEYWEWTPVIRPMSTTKIPLKHKLLKTEYWLIPNPSGRYIVNYNKLNNYYKTNRFNSSTINLVSTGLPISLAEYKDLLVINNDSQPTTYSITKVIQPNTTLLERTVNYKNTSDVLLTTTLPIDTVITINYLKPIDIRQILFKNSLFPQNIYINNQTFIQNSAYTF